MKKIAKMKTVELAATISEFLRKHEVENVLSGGGCAMIYSNGKYFSGDLDFVNVNYVPMKRIGEILKKLGFEEAGRGFKHPELRLAVDIVKAPLTVGEEKIDHVNEIRIGPNTLKLLTPTDCIKDRLAAFFHWNDQQSLETALMVSENNAIDLDNIRNWSMKEGMKTKFAVFEKRLTLLKKK